MAERLGLPVPKRLEPRPFPENLGRLTVPELLGHQNYWTEIVGYAKYQAAVLEASALLAQSEYDKEVDARFSAYGKGTKLTIGNKVHWTGANKAVRNRKDRATRLAADAGILNSLVYHCEKKASAISREIHRRGGRE